MTQWLAPEAAVRLRQTAFAVVYRILGEPAGAEDVAQQSLERLMRADVPGEQPRTLIATIAARQSLTELRNTRTRKRLLVTYGLPVPVLHQPEAVDAGIDLGYGLLVLSLTLTPLARAVFILRESFDLSFAEIATALDSTPAACRKVMSRARSALASTGRPSSQAAPSILLERLMQAIRGGDLGSLTELLTDDISLHSDGGGKAPAFGRLVDGRDRIARFLAASPRLLPEHLVGEVRNSAMGPVLLVSAADRVVLCILADADEGKFRTIYAISDPDKLDALSGGAKEAALARGTMSSTRRSAGPSRNSRQT